MDHDVFMVVIIILGLFIMLSSAAPVRQNIVQVRYIVYDIEYGGVYAAFAYGRQKSSYVGVNLASRWGMQDYIYGVHVPVRTAVSYFSKSEFGSTLRTEDGRDLLTEKDWGNTVLISWRGTYFYISRSYLSTEVLYYYNCSGM